MADRPNVLWFSLEDTSPRFGCYGDEIAETPNIDALAGEGVRYPNACSTAGVCAPSRSSIITGRYQTDLGTHHMRTTHRNDRAPDLPTPYTSVPPHYVRSFTEFLRADGYYCTNNAKTDYQFSTLDRAPLTAWDESGPDAHWRGRDEGQPFFSVFNPMRTHESGMWPEDDEPETDPDRVDVPAYLPDTDGVREQIARQYDNIARSDEQLGELRSQLEADGVAEETIIFVWSDHGEGLPRAKRSLYDGGINVPLIVAGPGIESGAVREAPISMVDLGPTVLELADVDPPPWVDGQPFLGDGPEVEERSYAFAARDRLDESYDMSRAVRTARYKYIRNYYPENPVLQWVPYRAQGPAMRDLLELHAADELEGPPAELFERRPPEELYDLQEDPDEVTNRADDPAYRDVLLELRAELDDWRSDHDRFGEVTEREMVERMHPDLTPADPSRTTSLSVDPEGRRETEPPAFVPNAPGNRTREPIDGGTLEGPATLQLHCSTQGASIAYALDEDPRETDGDRHRGWKLYTAPIRLPAGETTVYAKAVRYGFEESPVTVGTFDVDTS